MQGIIVRIISNLYTVKTEVDLRLCRSRGKFRNMGLTPLVGDRVKDDIDNKTVELESIENNDDPFHLTEEQQKTLFDYIN